MSDASTGEPQPITPSDLDTTRRMVRRCGVHSDADDVAQEVAIALARYPRPFVIPPERTPAEARLCILWGFVRRQVARHRSERARQRVTVPDEEERMREAALSAEERIAERARLTLLRAAVEELRTAAPELYAVLHGHLAGWPMARVAADLGIPEDTGWTRFRLGREAIRAQLQRWAAEEANGAERARRDAAKGTRGRWTRRRSGGSSEELTPPAGTPRPRGAA